MPKKKEYTANKAYSDIVYAWLQVNSEWDGIKGHVRTIPKSRVKYVDMADELGLSRQTVSVRFKKLLDTDGGIGLIHFNQATNKYELSLLPAEMAQLIEKDTLRRMVSALNENAISVYIYLFSRYCANQYKEFVFTMDQIKNAINISTKTRSNNYIITDILDVLQQLELLEYEVVTNSNGQDDVQTTLRIKTMRNTTKVDLPRQKRR